MFEHHWQIFNIIYSMGKRVCTCINGICNHLGYYIVEDHAQQRSKAARESLRQNIS